MIDFFLLCSIGMREKRKTKHKKKKINKIYQKEERFLQKQK